MYVCMYVNYCLCIYTIGNMIAWHFDSIDSFGQLRRSEDLFVWSLVFSGHFIAGEFERIAGLQTRTMNDYDVLARKLRYNSITQF